MSFKKPTKSVSEVKVLAKDVEVALQQKNSVIKKKTGRSSKVKNTSTTGNVIVNKMPRKSEWLDVAKVQIFLSAHLPARGVSPTFDTMIGFYSQRKALQMILRKAIVDYEHAINVNIYKNLPKDYVCKEPQNKNNLVVTSRTMPVETAQTARAFFDPMGFESSRAFGYKIATAALANFFQNEIK